MAKKVPCGVCGTLRWPSTHPGAPAVPTCRSCRAANPEHGKVSTYKLRKCRCDLCRAAWNAQCRRDQTSARARSGGGPRACVECGTEFRPRSNQITCSPGCRKTYLGRLGSHASRAEFYGVDYQKVDRAEVFESDGWTCGICALPVDRDLAFPDPGSATLDHILPISQGGGHVRENVQLAHFYCNTVKGAREMASC